MRLHMTFTLALTALLAACGGSSPSASSPTHAPTPTPAPPTSRIGFTSTPGAGAIIAVPLVIRDAHSALVRPGSDLLTIGLTMTSVQEAPWAQLNLYLLAENGSSCGQNVLDTPTFVLHPGETTDVAIRGFWVRVPCDVATIRAVLHTNRDEDVPRPQAHETIAEAVLPVRFTIRPAE